MLIVAATVLAVAIPVSFLAAGSLTPSVPVIDIPNNSFSPDEDLSDDAFSACATLPQSHSGMLPRVCTNDPVKFATGMAEAFNTFDVVAAGDYTETWEYLTASIEVNESIPGTIMGGYGSNSLRVGQAKNFTLFGYTGFPNRDTWNSSFEEQYRQVAKAVNVLVDDEHDQFGELTKDYGGVIPGGKTKLITVELDILSNFLYEGRVEALPKSFTVSMLIYCDGYCSITDLFREPIY